MLPKDQRKCNSKFEFRSNNLQKKEEIKNIVCEKIQKNNKAQKGDTAGQNYSSNFTPISKSQ